MFLKSIVVNNFRSIQNARADFDSGLNIIIGKNGVGKSNLLTYIFQNVSYHAIVSRPPRQRANNVEFEYSVCFNDTDENLNELTIYFKREKVVTNNELEYTRHIKLSKSVNDTALYGDKNFEIPATTEFSLSYNESTAEFLTEFDVLRKFQTQYVSFEIPQDPGWLAKSVKYEIDTEYNLESDMLIPHFAILLDLYLTLETNFFSRIAKNEAASKIEDLDAEQIKIFFLHSFDSLKVKNDLENVLSKYSPISDIRLNPNINTYYAENKILVENLIIEFRVNNAWIPWGHLSDGTKRLFYLITQCLSVTDGMLLIEEPELGIHPHQLYSLMQFIRDQANYKQIIVSTHSPIVLDILSPDELHRINIAKLTPKGTQFHKLSDAQIETAQKYMELVGDLSHYWLHSDLEDE